MKWLDIWVSFSERHFVVSRNHDDNKYRQIGVNRYLLGFLPKVGFQEVCVGLFWRPNPTPKRVVGFHICHFFLLGPSTPCQSIKTALLAVQNCFAQGVHHLIGVVLGPNRPFASPLRALNSLMAMGTITIFAIHGRNNFRDISNYACPFLHRGLGLFRNQAKHALVKGDESDILLLQQILYLRRPWGGQPVVAFFPTTECQTNILTGAWWHLEIYEYYWILGLTVRYSKNMSGPYSPNTRTWVFENPAQYSRASMG